MFVCRIVLWECKCSHHINYQNIHTCGYCSFSVRRANTLSLSPLYTSHHIPFSCSRSLSFTLSSWIYWFIIIIIIQHDSAMYWLDNTEVVFMEYILSISVSNRFECMYITAWKQIHAHTLHTECVNECEFSRRCRQYCTYLKNKSQTWRVIYGLFIWCCCFYFIYSFPFKLSAILKMRWRLIWFMKKKIFR